MNLWDMNTRLSIDTSEENNLGLSCMTPATCLLLYKDGLNEYEKNEIKSYSKIYYIGREAKKHIVNYDSNSNFGFDEAENRYRLIQFDHIAYRYQIISLLGQGSFGCVIKAIDHAHGNKVAIKIIRNEFRFHRQAQTEIKVLNVIATEDTERNSNCIRILNFFTFRKHICIVFPLLGKNLYELLADADYKGIDIDLVRTYSQSILQGLVFLEKQRIIHSDIKPENILISSRDQRVIKIIDFGSSCFENKRPYKYIQSRFYRAPEVLLEYKYGLEIDMWSFGCLLYEMANGRPLFPGENERDQMACIIGLLGLPSYTNKYSSNKYNLFFRPNGVPTFCFSFENKDGVTQYANSESKKGCIRYAPGKFDIKKKLSLQYDEFFYKLLFECLKYDPVTRLKPSEALFSEWLTHKKVVQINQTLKETEEPISVSTEGIFCEEESLDIKSENKKLSFKTISLTDSSTDVPQKSQISIEKLSSTEKVNSTVYSEAENNLNRYGHQVIEQYKSTNLSRPRRESNYVVTSDKPICNL